MRWIVGDDIYIGGTGALERDRSGRRQDVWRRMDEAPGRRGARCVVAGTRPPRDDGPPRGPCPGDVPERGRVRQPGVPAGARRRAAARLRGHLQRRRRASSRRRRASRIFPMALVPWWNIAAALDEVRRCAGMGLRGAVTRSNPEHAGLPDLAQPDWAPFRSLPGARALHQLPHRLERAGDGFLREDAVARRTATRPAWRSARPTSSSETPAIGNLIYSGVPERDPGAQVRLGGVGGSDGSRSTSTPSTTR